MYVCVRANELLRYWILLHMWNKSALYLPDTARVALACSSAMLPVTLVFIAAFPSLMMHLGCDAVSAMTSAIATPQPAMSSTSGELPEIPPSN